MKFYDPSETNISKKEFLVEWNEIITSYMN